MSKLKYVLQLQSGHIVNLPVMDDSKLGMYLRSYEIEKYLCTKNTIFSDDDIRKIRSVNAILLANREKYKHLAEHAYVNATEVLNSLRSVRTSEKDIAFDLELEKFAIKIHNEIEKPYVISSSQYHYHINRFRKTITMVDVAANVQKVYAVSDSLFDVIEKEVNRVTNNDSDLLYIMMDYYLHEDYSVLISY